jgi:hypothetical protein
MHLHKVIEVFIHQTCSEPLGDRFRRWNFISDSLCCLHNNNIHSVITTGKNFLDNGTELFILSQCVYQLKEACRIQVFLKSIRHFLPPLTAARGTSKNLGIICLYTSMDENNGCSSLLHVRKSLETVYLWWMESGRVHTALRASPHATASPRAGGGFQFRFRLAIFDLLIWPGTEARSHPWKGGRPTNKKYLFSTCTRLKYIYSANNSAVMRWTALNSCWVRSESPRTLKLILIWWCAKDVRDSSANLSPPTELS